MAYGVTTTSLLLTVGVAPAIASASVHLAEIGTTLALGTAHWRFGNVDWRIVGLLAVPGFIGAFVGAVVLSSLSAEAAEPVVSGILLVLGVYVLWRFTRSPGGDAPKPNRIKSVFMVPLGAMDALRGGGWVPIGTPTLLSTTDVEPRKVVGSIDASEFVVTIGASIGFLVGLGAEAINYSWVGALLAGGLIAAPIAAWIVKSLPPRMLGLSVGALIIITNLQTIGDAAESRRTCSRASPWRSGSRGSRPWRLCCCAGAARPGPRPGLSRGAPRGGCAQGARAPSVPGRTARAPPQIQGAQRRCPKP